ncbi:MAG: PAS domain S-box protein [Spirochaetia bacterium]|nr:PAS domain S-box protein [Spirochaetia bacterium]
MSKVRFMEEAPLELRLPLAQTGMPSALAAGGREGVVEGKDYRGKEVVAVLRSVPDSPWFLVVKMDTAELYAPLRSILYGFVGLVGALLVAITATIAGLWQRRAKNHYLQLYHAEKLREQSEERFRMALSGASVIVATCDRDLRYTWIYNTHPDFQKETVLGKRDTEISSLEGAQELMLLKWKIVESGGEVSSEIAFSTSTGEIIYDVKAKAMRNDNDEVIGVTTVAWDITARKELEIRYASLFNSVWDAILITDLERRIIDYNSAFAGLFEYSYDELMGRSSSCIYHDSEEREKVGYKLKEYTEESERKILLRYRKKSGATFKGETLLSYLRDTKGNVLGIIKVIRDVTDRELMEQQLIEAQKLEALGQLAGGIAHDFNNVLMAISGASQVLEKRTNDEANQKLIAAIRGSVKRGNAVTGRMLSFTRSSQPETKAVALFSFLSEFKDFAQHTLPQHVHVHIGEVGDEQGVYADPSQLQQVLITLSINAADAMPEGGDIYLEVRRPTSQELRVHNTTEGGVESYWCIEVIDEGTGMDEHTKSRAFDPFFTTKDSTKGTGLGLFVVYKILQLHKGWIDIDSSLEQGTTFIVGLPAAEETSKIYEAQEDYESGQGETILIIDDEAPILTMLDAALTENGYQTLSAENGEGSLKILEQEAEKVDLIITDIGLPDMNGKALILKIKECYPSIPIIAMTGYTDTAIDERLYKAGADKVVKKPYDMDELSRDIRSLL